MNLVFAPMFIQGMMGGLRRGFETGAQAYDITQAGHSLVVMSSWGAWGLFLAQIPFIINFIMSVRTGRKVAENPWEATTLEWAAPSPPPHGNFVVDPVVYRGPYEYSQPGAKADFSPQFIA
jgi:cytochrome c oxidase subunit 1